MMSYVRSRAELIVLASAWIAGACASGGRAGPGSSGTGGESGLNPELGGAPAWAGMAGAGARAGAMGESGAPGMGGSSAGASSSDGGASPSGGATAQSGGSSGAAGDSGALGESGASGCKSGPIGTISGALATGVTLLDQTGERVNAHGGGIIQVGDTFYMHGMSFSSSSSDNAFSGFTMYSSQDLATWKSEGVILPQQPSGELGPNRKGERPHIIRCPASGEFVLYAHAASADYQTDKEVVYATSTTVNGQYAYKGPLKNASGALIVHSDMSAYADETGAYVLTESGHVFTLAGDCHSFISDKSFPAVNGDSGGSESPTVFKANRTYYWIGSYKTGWRANNNFYSTAPAITGPWQYQGFIAPVTDAANSTSPERTWLSQSTWVQPVHGCNGTVYLYWGDHWSGTESTSAAGKNNYLTTHVLQPLTFDGIKISLPSYHASWKIDVGSGTWSP